jgi:hypothetical protein
MYDKPLDLEAVGRRLGATEELFWLFDQASPAQFAVVAEIEGRSEVSGWRRALDALQRRHPLMNVGVNPALRSFESDGAQRIPLRVVEGPAACWTDEVRRELATPFRADQAPLIRAVLLHEAQQTVLILTAHHAIADGLSLTFAVRDLLTLHAGTALDAFPPLAAQELAFGQSALDPASPITSHQGRTLVNPEPAFEHHRLDQAQTTALIAACRRIGATVQGALLAAVAVAGHGLCERWRRGEIRLVSPVSTRTWTKAGEQCFLSIIAPSPINITSAGFDDFWPTACKAAEQVRATASHDVISNALAAIRPLISMPLDVAAAHDLMTAAYPTHGGVTNLGVMPFGAEYGPLRLKALWGPAVLGVGREDQVIGALTFDGALHLTHSSHEIAPGLLAKTAEILGRVSSGTRPA